MVKTCFYASELVQGCLKVIILRNGMTGAPSRNKLFSLIFDLRRVIFGTGPLHPYMGWGFECLEYWKKLHFLPRSGQSRGHWSNAQLTNDLDFDHSEVENATSSNTQGTQTPNQHMDGEVLCQIFPSPLQKWARKAGCATERLAIKNGENVLLNSPGPAQRHKNMSSPLALFIGDIISIIPDIFENLKILTPKNAFAPVWNPGLGPIQAQRHFLGSKFSNFQKSQEW